MKRSSHGPLVGGSVLRSAHRSALTVGPSAALRSMAMVVIALALLGCASDGVDETRVPEYRSVVALKAPFYSSSPDEDAIPFIYLTEGTQVEWLKDGEGHTQVRLPNGDSGWVPSASLGTPNVPPAAETLPANDASPDLAPTEGGLERSGRQPIPISTSRPAALDPSDLP